MKKAERKRAKAAAKALPAHMQAIAFAKSSAKATRKHSARKLGTFGAASTVRHIDPSEYEVQA